MSSGIFAHLERFCFEFVDLSVRSVTNDHAHNGWTPFVSEGRTELKQREHRAATHLGIPFGRLEGDLPSQGRRHHRR
jgi:hypothetical protein